MHLPAAAGIRPATPADAGAVTDIEDRAFTGDRFNRRQIRYLLASPTCDACIAVEPDVAVAGYIMTLYRSTWQHGRVYSLAVAPECRGRGIGARLMAAAGAAARRRGCRALRLEVRADNRTAIKLYNSVGYQVIGGKPDYYSDGTAAICMQLSLTPQPQDA